MRLPQTPAHDDPIGAEAKIELRRYLAGVPYSHRRPMSAEETRALRRQILVGYALLALIGCAQVACLASSEAWGGAILLIIPFLGVACHYAPHWRSLKSGKVHVYIGRLQDLRDSDAVQKYFMQDAAFARNFDRYVEVTALGGGSRLWRVEGVEVGPELAHVQPIEIAVIPDVNEDEARPLTQPERQEIQSRILEFFSGRNLYELIKDPLWCALPGSLFTLLCVPKFSLGIFLTLALLFLWVEIRNKNSKIRVAHRLRSDLRAGIVKGGRLASGTPWVTNGEPAAWRLGSTKHGADPKALQ